eukprot:11745812-Alexandrium_andersonii.AAC.1
MGVLGVVAEAPRSSPEARARMARADNAQAGIAKACREESSDCERRPVPHPLDVRAARLHPVRQGLRAELGRAH